MFKNKIKKKYIYMSPWHMHKASQSTNPFSSPLPGWLMWKHTHTSTNGPAHTPDLEFIHTSRTTVGIVFKKHWTALPHDTGKEKEKKQKKTKKKKKGHKPFLCHYIKIVLLQKYKLGLLIR